MAKFKVGDKVQCAELRDGEDWDYHILPTRGEVIRGEVIKVEEPKANGQIYLIRVDINGTYTEYAHSGAERGEWWYREDQVSPIPTSRTTTIEWYSPDERLPNDGEKVVWMWDNEICGGYFRNDMFVDVLDSWNRISEVQFWAYAPDVR